MGAKIINRGRGPEIEGTRITVYDVLDYARQGRHRDRIAALFRLSSRDIQAALDYIQQHQDDVTADYQWCCETSHSSIQGIIHHGDRPRMALNIKDPAIHALARELAQTTGESLTQAVRLALQERLRRVRSQQVTPLCSLLETLDDIAVRCAALPDLDTRSPDDILGYDAQGLPH